MGEAATGAPLTPVGTIGPVHASRGTLSEGKQGQAGQGWNRETIDVVDGRLAQAGAVVQRALAARCAGPKELDRARRAAYSASDTTGAT